MARFALRIWSAIISAFAVMAVHTPSNSMAAAPLEFEAIQATRSKKPELFLEKTVDNGGDGTIMLAAHRSHSSHRSHRSHSSHYSGYGYRSRSYYPSSTPTHKSTHIKKSRKKAAKAEVASSTDNKKGLRMNDGRVVDCDYTWREGDTVNVMRSGKITRFNTSEVNFPESTCK